jgi:hypothetical protein
MLKISDADWAFKVLPAFTEDSKEFANLFWVESNNDALGMYGLAFKHQQIDDGFYRLIVVDPRKWMLAVLKFQFEVS